MKLRLIAAAAALVLVAAPVMAAVSGPIAAAIADTSRPAKDVEKDAVRKPADLIEFAKIKPGDVVVDIWPGGGYWSRIFSKIVGPKGHVVAYVPSEITVFKSDPLGAAKAMAAEPGLGNVEVISDPLASPPPAEALGTVDVAWTFENYHDLHDSFMKGADVDAFNKAVFALLKPGGYYVIVDHAAPAGSGLANTEDLHRIDPAALRAEVEKAGFVFDGESKVLAMPDDPRTVNVFDAGIRGKTDRFAYRFRKPKA
ncbi:putative methyltransferase [Caulobacter ginsengisoli]|uniref:Methyltransferase n=1 Tax=Caulobacter ginsengisoli TaxID=400775 RepID=A0ABU0IN42_9CAUL|nr:methyltransferase [Caulobacter ginsengisoli]MDQ0463415.1 putative methyltransferase [Caulobacter ginsengisoli]